MCRLVEERVRERGGGWPGSGVFADAILLTAELQPVRKGPRELLETPPRGVCVLRAAAAVTSSRGRARRLLHKNQNVPPLPFLSWSPPGANVSGFSSARASDQQGASARRRGAPCAGGTVRYDVAPGNLPTQSPFSSSFCKLFWI